MEDKFRYRLEMERKTKAFRLILVNTIAAAIAAREIDREGWVTINESGEREFLKAFVRYVKTKYTSEMLTRGRLLKQMRNYKKKDEYLKNKVLNVETAN